MKLDHMENTCRKKKYFTLSEQQNQVLRNVYERNPYPTSELKQKLSQELNIEENKVFQWFRNRRYEAKLNGEFLYLSCIILLYTRICKFIKV